MKAPLLFLLCYVVISLGSTGSNHGSKCEVTGFATKVHVVASATAPTPALKNKHAISKRHRRNYLGHIFHELSHGHLKAAIVGTSTLLVFLELFEEVAREVPLLNRLVGHKLASVHHGVFLLTLSHLVTTISEVVKSIEESKEIRHTLAAEKYVHQIAHESFVTEKAAAAAYDRAAIAVYGRGASTNFHHAVFKNHIPLDATGKPAVLSNYRGVVLKNGQWHVDPAAFGMEDEE